MDILKQRFKEKAEALRQEIKLFNKAHGNEKVDEVSVAQVFGGMRGIKSMYWETSELDPESGIRFRNMSIPEIREILPKYPGGNEPLPEGLFWYILSGDIPTSAEVKWLSEEWQRRSHIKQRVFNTIDSLDTTLHPMSQFSIAVLSMQQDSEFSRRYAEGIHKSEYWDAVYEDTMNLLAKLPRIAAYIYRRVYHNGQHIDPDTTLDWSGNFAHLLGFDDPQFVDYMRLYMCIHCDHEGGNASAHTVHLVSSTLSDPYLAFSAGLNALAGPLHGLANQEVIKWIFKMVDKLKTTQPSDEQVINYINETLAAGQVIPGYGHAVLRRPDPRFVAQKRFAEKHMKDSRIINIVWQLFDLVPGILTGLGKVKNPWPNVDAHSGAILVHYGMKEYSFYTVLFGVSRAMGVLGASIWSRALGLPLERPKSITFDHIKQIIEK